MRQFLLIFCFIGLSLCALDIPEHLQAPLSVMHKGCQIETKAPEDVIKATRNGNMPDVPELKCYILCLLEHSGMIDDDDTIHWKQVMHLLTPSVQATVEHVQNECGTKRGATRCETAWLTFKCYFEVAPEGSEIP